MSRHARAALALTRLESRDLPSTAHAHPDRGDDRGDYHDGGRRGADVRHDRGGATAGLSTAAAAATGATASRPDAFQVFGPPGGERSETAPPRPARRPAEGPPERMPDAVPPGMTPDDVRPGGGDRPADGEAEVVVTDDDGTARVIDGRTGELVSVALAAAWADGEWSFEPVYVGWTGELIPPGLGSFFAHDHDRRGGVWVTTGEMAADTPADPLGLAPPAAPAEPAGPTADAGSLLESVFAAVPLGPVAGAAAAAAPGGGE